MKVAFTPNGVTAYVVDFINNKVYPITANTGVVGSGISVTTRPDSICILPNGVTAYVGSFISGSVTPITLATNTAGANITVGTNSTGLAATPDSSKVFSCGNSGVYYITTASNTVSSPITVGSVPVSIIITPNGNFAYVANSSSNNISVISIQSNTVVATINNVRSTVFSTTAISIDGGTLYVPNTAQDVVTTISIATNTVTGIFSAGDGPINIALPSTSTASIGTIGDIIRVDGGKATITEYISSTQVMANITQPLTMTIPNDPNKMPIPAISGNWSLSRPTSVVSGLNHLEGMTVTGLADGGVITPQVVTNGQIELQQPASAINVGLAYLPQLQNMPLDVPSQTTTQSRRKDIGAVTVRIEGSRGFSVGSNQPDASWQENQANIPWSGLKEVKERNALVDAGSNIPLFTGDIRQIVPGDWATNAQTAIQQNYPLPLQVLAILPEVSLGDQPA